MKKIVVWVAAGFLSTSLVGCVSSGKYNKLEADNNSLQAQFHKLEADNNSLQAQFHKLEADNNSLQAQFHKLQAEYSACKNKVAQVEQEKEGLIAREKQSTSTYEQLMSQLQKEVSEGQVTISQYEDKLTLNVAEKIFFDSGSAIIKPSGKEVLGKLGSVIKGLTDKVIRVEGHTDNVPIAKSLRATYPTNWELSAARAITVVRFLLESAGVPPEMLMAAAFGEYRPIAPNDTPENKQKNRRIEIVLQNRDVLKRMETPIAPEEKESPTK